MFSTVVSLVVLSVLIVIVAVRLTRVADRIAETAGLSRGFVGVLLLAVATSLPELVTSLAAVLLCGSPGLAFGNVFGSNVVNLSFIGLMDLLVVGSIFLTASERHLRTARFVAVFTVFCMALIGMGRWLGPAAFIPSKIASLVILAAYVAVMRSDPQEAASSQLHSLGAGRPRVPWPEFAACAAGILVVGLLLTRACDDFARQSGLGQTFVGTLILALVTSIPELVVSIEAVRLGSIDMALGNIVGSNLFNLTILAVCDLTLVRGSLYAAPQAVSSLPAALGSLGMVVLTAAALRARPAGTILGRLSWPSVALILAYLASNLATYLS